MNDAPTFSINGLPTSTNSTSLAFLESAGGQTVNLANFFSNISVGSPFEAAAGQQLSRVSFVVSDPSGIFTGTGGAAPTTNMFSNESQTVTVTGASPVTLRCRSRVQWLIRWRADDHEPSPLTPRPRPFNRPCKRYQASARATFRYLSAGTTYTITFQGTLVGTDMNPLTAANGTNGTVGVATTVPGGGLVGSSPLSGIASLNFGIGAAKNGTATITVFLQDNGGTLTAASIRAP